MPIKRSSNSMLISPKDININLYQVLLLVILNRSLSKRSPVYLYLLFFWASFLDK